MNEKTQGHAMTQLMSQIQEWLVLTLDHGFGKLTITIRLVKGATREVVVERGKTIRFEVTDEEIPKIR